MANAGHQPDGGLTRDSPPQRRRGGDSSQRRARGSNPQPVSRHDISNVAASHSLTLQTAVFWCCVPDCVPHSLVSTWSDGSSNRIARVSVPSLRAPENTPAAALGRNGQSSPPPRPCSPSRWPATPTAVRVLCRRIGHGERLGPRSRNTTGQSTVRCPARREITSAARGSGQLTRRRRNTTEPPQARPARAMAQVDGSGTTANTVWSERLEPLA